jgi:hypothetical protein
MLQCRQDCTDVGVGALRQQPAEVQSEPFERQLGGNREGVIISFGGVGGASFPLVSGSLGRHIKC